MKKIAYLLTAVLILSIFAPFHSTVTFADENAALTRLNAVKMLAALLPSGDGGEEFADTADATAAYFRRLGIVKGSGDNLFMPDTPIRTQDFLLMLKRTLDAACPSLFYNNQHIIWQRTKTLFRRMHKIRWQCSPPLVYTTIRATYVPTQQYLSAWLHIM